MSTFFVSYDLGKPVRDYPKLYKKLDDLEALEVVESTYCFKSSKTAKELRDVFKAVVDSSDRVIIIQSSDWSALKAIKTPNDL